jgi:hypothetical protein
MCVARLRRVDIMLHVLHLLAPSNPFFSDEPDHTYEQRLRQYKILITINIRFSEE